MLTMTRSSFRWGIAGSGKIASDFAAQVAEVRDARLAVVYSRELARAERFRTAFGMERATDDFGQLLSDDSVDAIYLALPPASHCEFGLAALDARKPLLCEKPFALSLAQAETMVRRARETGTFCMEAMWLRFSPLVQAVVEMARSGELGILRSINIDCGYATPDARLGDCDVGRGALLNFAVYGVSLAQMLLGTPDAVSADMLRKGSGIDTVCSMRLRYPEALVSITASVEATLDNEAVITGTRGRVRLGAPFFTPGFAEHVRVASALNDVRREHLPCPGLPRIDRLPLVGLAQGAFWVELLRRRGHLMLRRPGDSGLRGEAIEVMNCVRAGRKESARMPLADTLAVAEIIERARAASV